MPIFKAKNENFFKSWSHEMAYVLGFFVADGSMFINPRGSCYAAFYSTDREILEKIKLVMSLDHLIGTRKFREPMNKISYSLQIGSKELFQDLKKLGLKPNKSKTINLPHIPKEYFPDFVRGYFDGDGGVTISNYYRKNRKSHLGKTMLSGFTSGSKKFLLGLRKSLQEIALLGRGTLYFSSRGHRLYYSVNDSKKLYNLMYGGLLNQLYLKRKKEKFELYS